jgi:hypothetical protein
VGHVIIGAQIAMTQQFLPPLAGTPQGAQSESTRQDEGHAPPPEEELPEEELPEEELLDELPPEDVPPDPEDVVPEELPPEEPAPDELPVPVVPTVPPEPPSEVSKVPAGCGESVPHATTTPNRRHTTAGSLKCDKDLMRAFLLNGRSGESSLGMGRYHAGRRPARAHAFLRILARQITSG